jgi:hypothetical protein
LATKSGDAEQVRAITELQKKDLKSVEIEMAEKSANGKNQIKEKYNQLACKV